MAAPDAGLPALFPLALVLQTQRLDIDRFTRQHPSNQNGVQNPLRDLLDP